MSYEGTVRNGVIVPDDGAELPEGMRVRFETADSQAALDSPAPSFVDEVLKIASTVKGLPSDFAEQHDHYIHGRPKR